MSHYWGNWGNNIPVAGVKADSVVCVSKQVTFDGSDSYDPDGVITEWRWDPGDGTGYLYGMVVTHTYANGGNYTVTLRVTDNRGATATATTAISVKNGWVFGKAHFPDSDETPLKGLKITVTMYYDQGGDVKYLHTYPAVYSSSSGYYEVDVSSNPFSIFSFDYWEYLWYGGWNRVAITAEACNGQQLCLSGLVHNVCTYAKIAMHPHHTHKLIFKDSATGEYLSGVKATYYDGFESHSTLESGGGSSVQWSDANPLLIAHVITKDGYRIRTPIIDHRGINVRSECYKETEVLMDKIVTAAFISFDKSRYYPEDVMEISYDSMSVPNCKVKLYDAVHNLVMINLRNGYTNSPPTVNYSLPTTVGYGQWLSVLEDADGNELAHAAASVGSQGYLSYDTSTRCKDKKIKISWQEIDPVFKVGTPPNNMKIELYDGVNKLLGTYILQTVSGTTTYTLSDTEDLSAKWKAKLIDQWNNLVDISSISVFNCSQVIIGKVRRVNGSPVRNCKVTIDLSFMGFGVFQVTTDATGGFKFAGLPPFPVTYIKSYKPGYKKLISEISLAEDELKLLNLVIEGLVKGTVTDEENNPVANAYVILEGGDTGDVVEKTQDNGNFDLPPKVTGHQKLRFMKNNFNVEEKSVNVEEISENALQLTKDKQLIRRALELFDANFKKTNVAFESSLVQLDQIDIPNIQAGIMELTDSGQKIALIEIATGAGESQGTGPGGDDSGDVECEFYGYDENGKAIIRCSYVNRLTI
ncbi:MAG: PKD domain-containing protein [Candidatus Methanoperedens sp.]